MQVQAVNGNMQSFKANPDGLKEAFINMDDRTMRQIAAVKAEKETRAGKKYKIARAVILSIPVIAAVAGAIVSPKLKGKAVSQILTKALPDGTQQFTLLKGGSARLLNGLKQGGSWLGYMAAGFGAFAAKDKLAEKSKKVGEFQKEHPILTTVGAIAVAVGAVFGIKKGAGAIVNKLKPETYDTISNYILKKSDALNDTRLMKAVSRGYHAISDKLGSKTKNALTGIINFTPDALLWGSVGAIFANKINFSNHINKNYNEMKEQQLKLAQAEVK